MKNYVVVILFFFITIGYAATDPTMPADWNLQMQASRIPKDIILSGILTSNHKAIAVINAKNVRVGDVISGYEITKITQHAVYLKNNHGSIMVPLYSQVSVPIKD
ncbi:MAG: hypothetical protein A3F12_02035 [Gammaproteobacteria bacterium RIFCSPHIGHO2_12_FULL_38_14]|nr:MAG: hypothetical protein A3F12_02035 [Gammaproteobacteria bacterium RIFCSPHIGHO2_12_FULL_38_14]